MKKSNALMSILLIGFMIFCACSQKNVEGVVISVPMSLSLNELMSGNVDNMTFTGDVVEVRLNDGKEVQALATQEQMEQAFEGKTRATLEKLKDEAHEGIEWKVISLEDDKEKSEK